jgi:preprotein translocase subunit SecG
VVGFLIGLLNILLVISSLFLICLVLIQRGKGGGLAGAFGGPGGSSAFGTKAGDVFTRVTIITAGIWFALAMFSVLLINNRGESSSAFQPGKAAATDDSASNATNKAIEDFLSRAGAGSLPETPAPPLTPPEKPDEKPATNSETPPLPLPSNSDSDKSETPK